jgi:hypothetical protein
MERRKRIGRIRAWIGACVANLSFLFFIALIGGLALHGLSRFGKPASPPIAILVVGQTNNASGATMAQVIFTNSSNHRYSYEFSTEVRKRSWWQNGSVQLSDCAKANALPPKTGRLLSFPTPQEADEWRVSLVAHRVLGGVETKVCELFRRLNLEYPLAKEIQVIGPEMLNPTGKKLDPPRIAGGNFPLAASATTHAN